MEPGDDLLGNSWKETQRTQPSDVSFTQTDVSYVYRPRRSTMSSMGMLDESFRDISFSNSGIVINEAYVMALEAEKAREVYEHKFITADVRMAAQKWDQLERELCIPSVQIEPSDGLIQGAVTVSLTFNVSKLPDMVRQLWELGDAMTVSVLVDGISKKEFRASLCLPTVLARMDANKASKFAVGECLANLSTPIIAKMYHLSENKSPDEVGSFFAMLYESLTQRLETLTEFCMMCSQRLRMSGFLPSICEAPLCQFQYQELGLMSECTTPRCSVPVLALLIMAFSSATSSKRRADILTPAPSTRNPDKLMKEAKELHEKHYMSWDIDNGEKGNGEKDAYAMVASVMPCARAILETPTKYAAFRKKYPAIAELVEWLVISNQTYLEIVPPALNVNYLETVKQFLFVSDTPAKQAEFDDLVKANGGKTRYLFHGSRMENWHAIIRSGLKNMSGTKFQLVGALHGEGIYFSNYLPTAFHYAIPFDHYDVPPQCMHHKCCLSMAGMEKDGLTVLALVEVVDTKAAIAKDEKTIVVVNNEKWCSIRMLVAYHGTKDTCPKVDLNTISPLDRKKIQDTMHMFKTGDLEERAKHCDDKKNPMEEEAENVEGNREENKVEKNQDSDDQMEDHEEEEEESSEGGESDEYNAFDDPLVYETEATVHEYLKADVREATKTWHKLEEELFIPSVQIEPSISGRAGQCCVVMTLNIAKLPDMIRHVWELGTAMTVAVIVDGIDKREFRAFETRPTVLARIDSDKPSRFPVGECLMNVIKPIVAETFSLQENLPPSMTGSFFSMLYEQLLERMRTLTEFCMVCGNKLYAGGLLPSICDGELCQYQYQELDLMDGLTMPRVSPPVLALLMTLFNAAVHSERREDILMPAPPTHDLLALVRDTIQLYKNVDKKHGLDKNDAFNVYKNLACVMPCATDILKSPSRYREFKKVTPRIAQFVECYVITNRSYLELLPAHLEVPFLKAPLQFICIADTPAKQAQFDALKKANGGKTRYLFHGSRSENWHSIVRAGLKNMSGSKYMLMGQSHGAGIYLGSMLEISYRYCTLFDHTKMSENCANKECCLSRGEIRGMILLALVEVVDTPEAYQHHEDSFSVVKDEKWCSIRMLLAYCTSRVDWSVDLKKMTDQDRMKIEDVVQAYKTDSLAERVKVSVPPPPPS